MNLLESRSDNFQRRPKKNILEDFSFSSQVYIRCSVLGLAKDVAMNDYIMSGVVRFYRNNKLFREDKQTARAKDNSINNYWDEFTKAMHEIYGKEFKLL